MYENIFLTYNEGSAYGLNTADRVKTLASLYDLFVYLPSREELFAEVSKESKQSILVSNMVIALNVGRAKHRILSELTFAQQLEKPMIVINRPGFKLESIQNAFQVNINYPDISKPLCKIGTFIKSLPMGRNEHGRLLALNSIALGLLALRTSRTYIGGH